MLNFISRAEWQARLPKSVDHLAWSSIDTIYVHYTSMMSDETGDPKDKMRGIQNYHMDTKGWLDVAYNWAFARTGEILMGRGWNVKAGATGPENSHSTAFVFLGGDREDRDDVTAKGREALGKLIREAMRLKGSSLIVKGHTQAPGSVGQTSCPGKELLSYIAMKGWVVEPPISYPRRFFLFAAWYLGEGEFEKYGPHNLSVRPKELPGRYTPGTVLLMTALRDYLRRRK